MIKLAIGVPAYGGKVAYQQSELWCSLGASLVKRADFRLVMFGCVDTIPVDRARNMLVAHAMQLDADWLFMLDADTWIAPPVMRVNLGSGNDGASPGEALLRMIADTATRQAANTAVVAAPVVLRDDVSYIVDLGPKAYRYAAYRGGKTLSKTDLGRHLVDVDAVGAACMAVHLPSINEAKACFKFTDQLSEDREFCRQMREAGFKIAVDGRVRTGHLSKPLPLYSE